VPKKGGGANVGWQLVSARAHIDFHLGQVNYQCRAKCRPQNKDSGTYFQGANSVLETSNMLRRLLAPDPTEL